MTFVVSERVKETTTTTGIGTITLDGAFPACQTFVDGIGTNNTTYYCIVDETNNAWEVGIGTVLSTPSRLQRDTILRSSNNNMIISLGIGTKDVFCPYPAARQVSYGPNNYDLFLSASLAIAENVGITGSLNVLGNSVLTTVTGSTFKGNGTQITGVVTSSFSVSSSFALGILATGITPGTMSGDFYINGNVITPGTTTIGSATNPIIINRLSNSNTFGAISFNGSLNTTGTLGINARASDGNINYRAQTGGNHIWYVGTGLTAAAAINNTTFTSNVTLLTTSTVSMSRAGTPVTINNSNTASDYEGVIAAARGGGTKWFLGFNSSDQFVLTNAAGNAANLSVTDGGILTARSNISGATGLFSSGITSNGLHAFSRDGGQVATFDRTGTGGVITEYRDDGTFVFRVSTSEIISTMPLTISSSMNITGDLNYSDTIFDIEANTSDGSDTKQVRVSGGGDGSSGRGAYIRASGNEHATTPGELLLAGGNVTGGKILFSTGGSDRGIWNDNGLLSLTSGLLVTGSVSSSTLTVSDGLVCNFTTSGSTQEPLLVAASGSGVGVLRHSRGVAVGAVATAIFNAKTIAHGGLVLVTGIRNTGTAATRFSDVVAFSQSSDVTVLHSGGRSSAAARTYSKVDNSTELLLSMASDTYDINVFGLGLSPG